MRRTRLAVYLTGILVLMLAAGAWSQGRRKLSVMQLNATSNADHDENYSMIGDWLGSLTNGGNVRYTRWYRDLPTLAPPLPLSRDGHAGDHRQERPVEVFVLDAIPGSNPIEPCECDVPCGLDGEDPCVCEQPCGAICINDGTYGTPGPGKAPNEVGWRCDVASAFTCDDIEACEPACVALSGSCVVTSDCCEGFCHDGVCITPCLANGSVCADDQDCCFSFCTGLVCGPPTTTSTSTSTSTSSSTSTSTSSTSTSTLNTSTTTSTSSTSTSSSTSSSTSTSSTTTTNTCPTTTTLAGILAPSWEAEGFVGIYHMETCPTDTIAVDSSGSTNPLEGFNERSNTARQGAGAYSPDGSLDALDCQSGCTPNDFTFQNPGSDFSVGLWSRPTTQAGYHADFFTSITLNTSNGFPGPGWYLLIFRDELADVVHRFGFGIHDGSVYEWVQSAATYPQNAYHHHGARYRVGSGLMELFVDGVLEADTDTSNPPPDNGSATDYFRLGTGSQRIMIGQHDEAWVYPGCLSDETICKIAVCHTDGTGCACSGAAYSAAPLHSSFGGPIACTLPACNSATVTLCP